MIAARDGDSIVFHKESAAKSAMYCRCAPGPRKHSPHTRASPRKHCPHTREKVNHRASWLASLEVGVAVGWEVGKFVYI